MMAFSGMIIKASSRQCVVPLTRCAIRTSRNQNASMFGFGSQLRNCSSTTVEENKDLVDAKLYKAVKSEYNLSKIMFKHSQVNTSMGYFPLKLDYFDLSSDREFRFKRKFPDGERVFVSLKDNKASPRHMTVHVGKSDVLRKSDINFKISACKENIVIESVYGHKDRYKELKFEELDNEFQQALIEYLNVRGINRYTVTILLDLVAQENQKADLLALKHFKKVVDKLVW